MANALPLLLVGGAALLLLGGKKKSSAADGPGPSPAEDEPTAEAAEAAKVWEDRQMALDFLGYRVGAIDGDPGASTRTAIKTFQADSDLEPTGEWDKETAAAMKAAGLSKLRDMSWDALRDLWVKYFPGWSDTTDDTIGFDDLFERLTSVS